MNLFNKDKKGALMQAIAEAGIALLIMAIGILLMGTLSKVHEGAKMKQGETFIDQAIADNNIALYLKQPVEVDDKILTMADLIVLAYEQRGDYEDEWKGETHTFFYGLEYKVEIIIKKEGGESLSYTVTSEGYQKKSKLPGQNLLYNLFYPNRGYYSVTSNIYLPSYDYPLEIEFKRWIKKGEDQSLYE